MKDTFAQRRITMILSSVTSLAALSDEKLGEAIRQIGGRTRGQHRSHSTIRSRHVACVIALVAALLALMAVLTFNGSARAADEDNPVVYRALILRGNETYEDDGSEFKSALETPRFGDPAVAWWSSVIYENILGQTWDEVHDKIKEVFKDADENDVSLILIMTTGGKKDDGAELDDRFTDDERVPGTGCNTPHCDEALATIGGVDDADAEFIRDDKADDLFKSFRVDGTTRFNGPKIIVIDSCYSGGMMDGLEDGPVANAVFLMASGTNEESRGRPNAFADDGGDAHFWFPGYLIAGLAKKDNGKARADSNEDNKVTVGEWFDYASEKVTAAQPLQHPQREFTYGSRNWAVLQYNDNTLITHSETVNPNPNQEQKKCSTCGFSIAPASRSFPTSGGTGSVTVTATGTCAWRATSDVPWITITSGSPGSGSGTVNYSVAANTDCLRSGTMTIAGRTFTVTQDGAFRIDMQSPDVARVVAGLSTGYQVRVVPSSSFTGNVSLSVSGLPSGTTATFSPSSVPAGGSSSLLVATSAATPPGTYQLSIIGTSGAHRCGRPVTLIVCAPNHFTLQASPSSFTVPPGASAECSINVSPTACFQGPVSFSVSGLPSGASATFMPPSMPVCSIGCPNISRMRVTTSATTPAGTYSLTITGTGGGIQRTTQATLVVSTCTYSIAPTSRSFPATGGTGSVTVTTTSGCSWTASSGAPWITITSGSSGSGPGPVIYSVQANPGSARSATLTIAGWTHTVTQEGASYLLTVNRTGTGTGTVTSNPAGINCGSACSASFASGTQVTLTATPAPGSIFVGWSGDCTSDGRVTMSANRTCTATFDLQSRPPISFTPATNYPVGANPQSVAAGDLNGDGIPDLAAANWDSNIVSILLGDGTGRFTPAPDVAVHSGPYAVAVADLNADGILDLAVTRHLIHKVSICLGDGAGSFGVATDYDVGANPRSVALGDFNQDGILDVATANYGSNTISILIGDGTGSFRAARDFAVGTQPHAVAIGDLNGDGLPDLAVANNGSVNVSILLGDGTGSFGAAINFTVRHNPRSVAIGDINQDGRLDLAVANYASDEVSLLLSDGAGSFDAARNIALGAGPRGVALGDFNSDGKLDLAVTMQDSNMVSILLGDGAGAFGEATNFGVGNNPRSVVIGDFNGDGKPDLAVANAWSNDVSILLNTTP